MRICLAAWFACLILVSSEAYADTLVSPDIAKHAAADFKQALPPGFEVIITDPLTLQIQGQDGTGLKVSLDGMNSVCLADPEHCDAALADYVRKGAETVKERDAPTTKEQLRAVVRPSEYVDELKRMTKGHDPVAAPLVGGLSVVCVFDRPSTMRVAMDNDLASLGLSASATIDLCRKNTASALPPLVSQLNPSTEHAIGVLPVDPYQSSRLMFHDDWAPIAAKFGGSLIVAVPAANVVIYGPLTDNTAIDAMSTLAKKFFGQAQRPVSSKVFRWTPAGWDVVSN
jgi:uncharacterized protein YtpQ (UPF0354 family)